MFEFYAPLSCRVPEQSLALPDYVFPKRRLECETCWAQCDAEGFCPQCDVPCDGHDGPALDKDAA